MPVYGLPILRSIVLVFSIGFLVFIVNSGNWVDRQLISRQDQTALEESLNVFINYQLADKNIPGLSISVIQSQQTVFEEGYGYSDLDQNILASPYTVYYGGGIAQLFTTIAILQRVDLGYLNLDEPVHTYLPSFEPRNPYGLPVTLRQILSHQSGLPTEPLMGHSFDPRPISLTETVNSLNVSSIVYPPETFTKFSNAGFGVAGLIIETTTERPFSQYMRAILDRMDLMRTSFSPRLDLKGKLAQGFTHRLEGFLEPTTVYESGNVPASNLYTTVNDLGTFLKVIFGDGQSANGTILSAKSLEQMWTIQLSTARKQIPFGLGLSVSYMNSEPRASLSTSHQGYSAHIDFLPESNLGIAILANVDNVQATLEQIGTYALELLKSEQNDITLPAVPRTYPIDSTLAALALGYYEAPAPLYISALDEDFYLYRDGRRHRLRSIGDSLIVDDPHSFGTILLSDGLSIQLDNTLYLKKDNLSAPEPDPIYDSLLGAYGLKDKPIVLVEYQRELYALQGWISSYKLTPVSKDTFALPADGLYGGEEVTFTRDELDNVTQVRFANMTFDRIPEFDYTYSFPQIPLNQPFNPQNSSASPPVQDTTARNAELVDLAMMDPLLNVEVPLASKENIFGTNLYNEARILLQQPIADAIFRIKRRIRSDGLGLIIYDAYRPWRTTESIWSSLPDSMRTFFTDPDKTSCQNRGAGISLSLYDLNTESPLPMPTEYGAMSSASQSDFPLIPAEKRRNRELLRRLMEAEGFRATKYRWWYFNHDMCDAYPVIDILHENVNQSDVLNKEPISIIR